MRTSLTLAAVLLVAGCGTVPRAPEPSAPEPRHEGGAPIARIATQLIGSPYHFGGADLHGFDCSGLAVYTHERVGLEIPRTAEEQQRAARPVALDSLQPGDLVFFRMRARHVNHVGIYAGDGRFIHAPRSGEVVSYGNLDDPYYRTRFAGAGRFWSGPPAPNESTSPR